MANRLKMANIHSVLMLRARGWSARRIARELGVDRETVARYLRLAATATPAGRALAPDGIQDSNAAIAPIGNPVDPAACPIRCDSPDPAIAPLGNEPASAPEAVRHSTDAPVDRDPPGAPTASAAPIGITTRSGPRALEEAGSAATGGAHGPARVEDVEMAFAAVQATVQAIGPPRRGPLSQCEPLRDAILSKLEQGLSAVRIYQDLSSEHGASVSYHSVRRFVARLEHHQPLPFRRMECGPGEEAQVDFGSGAPVIRPADPNDPSGKTRRRCTHVLRVVLSHSRKGFSEAVFRQTSDNLIQCLENAFQHFGGAPKTLVVDNLKAAVTQADWFDPELNPKVEAFCRHYGTVMLPTRPRMPRHKGKIERGIDYVQENALKGRRFQSLEDQNRHLLEWETAVADRRLHGTTRQQVIAVFAQIEKPAMLPLPAERFPCFQEAQRTVQRDGHVAVANAYYSAPPEYVGHQVWARWDSHLVRIFNRQMLQIAVHVRSEPGRFSTQDRHIVSAKITRVERGAAWLLERARTIGSESGRWAEAMLAQRGVEGLRVLSGLISLAQRPSAREIEQACRIAHSHAAYRLRVLRQLIRQHDAPQEQLAFLDRHPIIRDLSVYDAALREMAQEEFIQESIQKLPYREPAWTPAVLSRRTEKKSIQKEETDAARVSEALRAMLPEPEETLYDE